MAFHRSVFGSQNWHGSLSRLCGLLVIFISFTFLTLSLRPASITHARDQAPARPLVKLDDRLTTRFSSARETYAYGGLSPGHLNSNAADAKCMEALFGGDEGRNPGSARRIYGITGEIALFASITHDKKLNSVIALIQELLGWIEANTDYDVSNSRQEPPTLRFCTSGDSIFYEGHSLIIDEKLAAVYDISSRTITIAEPWTQDDPHDISRLLHELIHDVQTRNKKWSCWGEAERIAYKLQEKWLLARGVKPGFNWVQIFLLTRCRRNIHS